MSFGGPEPDNHPMKYRIAREKMGLKESSVLQDDLRDLCRALGLPDAPQPKSPHEVLRECIAAVEKLRSPLRQGYEDTAKAFGLPTERR